MRENEKDGSTLLALRVPDFEALLRKVHSPRLRDWPVAILTSLRSQGRVLAACPVARAEGVREEMYRYAARERCPDLKVFLTNPRMVDETMDALVRLAGAYSPLVERCGGGRVLLDTRGTERLWGAGDEVAERLRGDVRNDLSLPVAAGLAARKPWSLLASRAAEVGGTRVVPPGGEDAFLSQIPVDWVDGLTPGIKMRMLEMKITTIGQLRQFDRRELLLQFGGACADALWRVLRPDPWDPIPPAALSPLRPTDGGIRLEAVMAVATVDLEKVRLSLRCLVGRLASDLRDRHEGAGRLGFTLIYTDGAIKTAQAACGGYVQDEDALAECAFRLLDRTFRRRVRVSRIWLAAESLSAPERQGVLFPVAGAGKDGGSTPRARGNLFVAMDRIKKRYGDTALGSASLLPGA